MTTPQIVMLAVLLTFLVPVVIFWWALVLSSLVAMWKDLTNDFI